MKLGNLDLFVSLGAIARWEEVRGKKFLTAFNENTYALLDLSELIFQMHYVACKRLGKNIAMDSDSILDSFTYAQMVITVSEATPEILKLYGSSNSDPEGTKKKK